MTKPEDPVVIFTDGACEPNPGIGGWAAILRYKDKYKEISGGERDSTNNRMELMAAIKALEALKKPVNVALTTDSEYLKRGVTEWMPAWKRAGWQRKTGALKNVDLWKRLDELTQKHCVQWHWVRGHTGHPMNERCDELATEQIRKQRSGERADG